ncbi:hypothetical protein BJV41_000596 [Clostridium beijerinckii]|nr:hypothetical protein [Clostridium beijerinckii]OOM41887.1 putative efflux pump membrane fusion protein [Clostridium beijerinckii]
MNSTRPEQIEQAQAALDSAKATYDASKKDYDRTKALVEAGAATEVQLETAQQQLTSAESGQKSAEEQLEMLKNGATETNIDVYKAEVKQTEEALKTGLILFPEAIATAISMVLYGKIGNKFDVRLFAVFALILIGINSYSMSKITLDTPNMTMSNASALTNTVKQIGTSIGVTIITSVMQHRNVIDYSNLASQVTSFNKNSMKLYEMLQGVFIKSGMSAGNAQGIALNKMFGEVALKAQLQALNDTMLVISIITAIVIIPTLLLKQGKQEEIKVIEAEG